MTGFEYIEQPLLPMFEIKLNGKSITPKQLTEIAEQMRVELLNYGVKVELKENGN